MGDRQVTSVGRNLKGIVTSLRSDAWWSPVSTSEAIKDIEHGKHRYFLKVGSRKMPILVANGNGKKRLVAHPEKVPIEVAAEAAEIST